MTKNNSMNWVLGGALLLIGLFVIVALILVRSQAEETPQASVDIDNEAPSLSASDIKICSGTPTSGQLSGCSDISDDITLTAGATDQNTIVFIARDGNGTSDLAASANAVFFHSSFASPAGNTCTDDNNTCYSGITCSKSIGITATSAYYTCSLPIAYYANYASPPASYWRTWVNVSDTLGSTAYATAADEKINELKAATFGNIPFGTRSLGYEDTNLDNIDVEHINNGNSLVNWYLLANTDLGCSVLGTIPASNVKVGNSAVNWSSQTYTLSSLATVTVLTGTGIRTNDDSTSAHIDHSYWAIKIPDSGISGTCNATITAITW